MGRRATVPLFRRQPSEQQQAWVAIQRRVAETLREQLLERDERVTTPQEAEFPADHIADDLMALDPRVAREHWVQQEPHR